MKSFVTVVVAMAVASSAIAEDDLDFGGVVGQPPVIEDTVTVGAENYPLMLLLGTYGPPFVLAAASSCVRRTWRLSSVGSIPTACHRPPTWRATWQILMPCSAKVAERQ